MAEISNYKVASSPHKVGNQTVRGIMLDVIIALLPCVLCGVIFYGLYSLMLVVICVATCLLSEQIYQKIRKKPFTTDLSAVVTGIILGLNLPPRAPWYIPVIGGVFAIVIVKMLFGGIGKNFANPAATARVFLLLAYGSMTAQFIGADVGNMILGDVSTSATYLSGGVNALQDSFWGVSGYWGYVLQLFFGVTGGSIGETCVPAILAGGVYLCVRKIIDWRIPVVYIATSALMVLACYQSASEILLQLFAGGLMFGAVFMATDYATSPKWEYNRILYAVGLGVVTVLIRKFGIYPEGVSLAILIMNLFVPLMDRYILPVRFGQLDSKGAPVKPVMKYAMWILCAVGALSLVVAAPVVASIQAKAYTPLELTGNYDYIQSVETRPDGNYRFRVKGSVMIQGYEQKLEYLIVFEGKEYRVSDIDPIAESTMGYVLKPELFIGKGYEQIENMTESDLSTGATYTTTKVRDMILECYSAFAENGVRTESVAAGLAYKHVKSIVKDGISGNFVVNVTGIAKIPFGDSVYEQALEYNVHIDGKDFIVRGITPIKQSTMDAKYQLKRELFIGKDLAGILALGGDSFTGATYTHNEFVSMLEESYRALTDAGVGVTDVPITGDYEYVTGAKSSAFFGGTIYTVEGKAVLTDQGGYEQPLEYNICIEGGKVTYIGAIKQSTWGYPAKTEIFIGKTESEIEGLDADEMTGATFTNTKLKEMILEAFGAAGGERA